MGYDIDTIKNRCERLAGIRYLDTVDSTNQEARRIASQEACDGLIVLAGRQSAGRGRMGRSWSNGGDDAIAMSIVLRPSIKPENVSMLTIIAALAVSEGIEKACGLKTDIKWPNDLKHNGRKLCGILSESVFSGNDFFSIIGIGINVNTEIFPEELKDIAASITQYTGKKENRESIITESINSFFRYYDILCRDQNLSSLTAEYNEKCITEGGINKFGELIMPDGSLKRSGEV